MPLNGDLENNGVGHPAISCTATVDNAGKIGKCYVCASGNHISFTNPITTSTTDFAISCWVYITEYTSGYSSVFSSRTATSGKGIALWIQSGSIRFDDGEMWTVSNTFTLNTWTHICVTYSKTNGKSIYVNGNLVGSKATVGTLANLRSELFIGYDHYGYYLGGKINDLRVWEGSTPSPKEIEILARGLVVHYPLSDPYIEGTSNLIPIQYQSAGTVSGWGGHTGQRTVVDASNFPIPCNTCNKISITYSGSSGGGLGQAILTINCTPSSTYSYSCYIRTPDKLSPLNANILYRYELKSDGTQVTEAGCWASENTQELGDNWYRVWGTFTVSSSTVSFRVHNFFYPNKTCDYYIGCWQLELKNHVTPYVFGSRSENVVYDVSGFNYHGTKVGSQIYSSDTPKYSISTSFNGVDDCIQVPLNTFFPNAGSFTINLWFKKSELGSKGYETVFGGISGFEMDTRGGASTTLSYYVTGNGRGLTVQSPLNFDTWYMLTMVCDGTNELYYLNGEYKKQIEKKGMPSGNYFIGAWRDSVSQNFKGLISDFRVYATALSATQVAELYNTAASISNNGTLMGYEFVEQ